MILLFLLTFVKSSPDISFSSFQASLLKKPFCNDGSDLGGCINIIFAYHSSFKPALSLSSYANSKFKFGFNNNSEPILVPFISSLLIVWFTDGLSTKNIY